MYLENREIYLFDEWAADQDPQFKEFFYRDILRSLKEAGKMVLIISHDDRYFHLADNIVKMDQGVISSQRGDGDDRDLYLSLDNKVIDSNEVSAV